MNFSAVRRFALVAAFGVVATMLLFVAPAFAHARLVETSPSEGEELTGSPVQVRLRFSEPVEAVFDPIKVRSEDESRVDLDDARLDPEDPAVVAVDLEENLPAGRYTVEWRVTSEDGHPIHDEFSFVSTPSAGADSPEQRTPVERVSEESPTDSPDTGLFLGAALVVAATITVGLLTIRRN